jgi:hypothetical protein
MLLGTQRCVILRVNVWQSPNGFDILGIVIHPLKEEDTGDFELEAMPLYFVQLSQRHTGNYLAKTVQLVVEKFKIQNQVSQQVSLNWSLAILTKFFDYCIRFVGLLWCAILVSSIKCGKRTNY